MWPLCRLRYAGYASEWGFAFYAASSEKYEDSFLPSRLPRGTPEQALDCACGTYLNDPSASGHGLTPVSTSLLSPEKIG